jgi:peptidoglycan hydrolase CwlO-like protein
MRVRTGAGLLACIALTFSSLALSQGVTTEDSDTRRLRALELQVSNLESLLRVRTDTPGPQDRTNRDFNIDSQLNQFEQRLQRIENEILNLQRQVQEAQRIASQAEREAASAQQTARDAAARIPF